MFPSFPTSYLLRSSWVFFNIPLRTNVRVSWNIYILKMFWLYWWCTVNHFVKERWVTWEPNTAWVSIPAHSRSYPPTHLCWNCDDEFEGADFGNRDRVGLRFCVTLQERLRGSSDGKKLGNKGMLWNQLYVTSFDLCTLFFTICLAHCVN